MAENKSGLKLEAKNNGVWLSAESGDFSQMEVYSFLKKNGVRKYEMRQLESFIRAKNGEPCRIAAREPYEELAAKITVVVQKGGMSASVMIDSPFFTKPWPTVEEIIDALAVKSVVFGIDRDAIQAMLDEHRGDEYIVVASGLDPVPGKNARIELLIDPDKMPEIREDEKVDFWSRSALVTVRPGDKVALKHPAEPGRDGKTVIGTVLKAPATKDIDFPVIDGLAKDEDNPLYLVATMDGQLKKMKGKLTVLPEFQVDSDVDFGVGSIDFNGAVRIKGSVREKFHVIADGNIDIKEMVEGAEVESQGNITIAGGVRGMGKATIKAAGDVSIGFADQATIRSGGSITVGNAILHSNVYARDSVIVLGGQKSQIAGGRIEAGVEVACQSLGSEMGTRTEVIVGLPPDQLERRRVLQAEVDQCNDNLKKIDPNLAYLKKLEAAGGLDDQKRAMLLSLTRMKFQLQAALSSMKTELEGIETQLQAVRERGIVRAKKICYAGVQITIRGITYQVRENCKFTSFVVEDGLIVLKPFDYQLASDR